MTTYKDISRQQWSPSEGGGTMEAITLGAVLRIADACELMAKDRADMERRLTSLREENARLRAVIDNRDRVIAGLRGHITRVLRKGGAQ